MATVTGVLIYDPLLKRHRTIDATELLSAVLLQLSSDNGNQLQRRADGLYSAGGSTNQVTSMIWDVSTSRLTLTFSDGTSLYQTLGSKVPRQVEVIATNGINVISLPHAPNNLLEQKLYINGLFQNKSVYALNANQLTVDADLRAGDSIIFTYYEE